MKLNTWGSQLTAPPPANGLGKDAAQDRADTACHRKNKPRDAVVLGPVRRGRHEVANHNRHQNADTATAQTLDNTTSNENTRRWCHAGQDAAHKKDRVRCNENWPSSAQVWV